jgi:hypothetical protein
MKVEMTYLFTEHKFLELSQMVTRYNTNLVKEEKDLKLKTYQKLAEVK